MFTWINKQGVTSTDGFEVQFVDRFTCEYRENGKTIKIEIDNGVRSGKAVISYSRSSFKTWQVFSKSISQEEQERVIKNFRDALAFQDLITEEYD